MSDALEDVENRVQTFSLAEQIHLLNFIANNINKRSSILNNQYSEEESLQKMREAIKSKSAKRKINILN